MSSTTGLEDSLLDALAALTLALKDADVPAVIVGGVAVSLLSRPRFTRDIDALVDAQETQLPKILDAARSLGIVPRVDDVTEVAQRVRVLLLRHAVSQVDIDIILGGLPFEREAVAAGQIQSIGTTQVRLPRVEDLMIMKAVAQRPQDLLDLEALMSAYPTADIGRVRQWVREFASAATMPSLLHEFDRIVSRVLPDR